MFAYGSSNDESCKILNGLYHTCTCAAHWASIGPLTHPLNWTRLPHNPTTRTNKPTVSSSCSRKFKAFFIQSVCHFLRNKAIWKHTTRTDLPICSHGRPIRLLVVFPADHEGHLDSIHRTRPHQPRLRLFLRSSQLRRPWLQALPRSDRQFIRSLS